MNHIQRQRAAAVVANMPNPPDVTTGIYIPEEDVIIISEFTNDDAEYYSILFHEICHASGHPSRLGRYTIREDRTYKSTLVSEEKTELLEELCAEIGAALLAAEIHVISLTNEMHEVKIADYKSQLEDSSLLKLATNQALEACQYILGRKVSLGILPYSIKRLLPV